MTITARHTTRRPGVHWAKFDRLKRELDTLRAKVKGLADHRVELLARRRDIRAFLAGDDAARYALEGTARAEALPDIAWLTEPEIGLAQVDEAVLRAVNIDPDAIDEILALNAETAALGRELSAAHADLDQRAALVARLTEWAHHATFE